MNPRFPDRNPGTPGRGRAQPGRTPGERRPRPPTGPPRLPHGVGREIPRRDFHARPVDRPGANFQVVPESQDGLWRIFIAVDLPVEAKAALTGTAGKMPEYLRPAVRWSRADMMHLTVRFLGDTDHDRVEAIGECMREAAERSARFTLRLDDTGAFPELSRPRVLWVGIAGELKRLQMLHTRLEGSLSQIGIALEDRIYNPHLTVGRLQREVPPIDAAQVGQSFAHVRLPEPRPELPVESLVLYRSRLLPEGPRYEELARAQLG